MLDCGRFILKTQIGSEDVFEIEHTKAEQA